MKPRYFVYLCVFAWLGVFAASLITGDKNEIGRFIKWQLGALAVAAFTAAFAHFRRSRLRSRDKMIGFTPIGISGVVLVSMAALAMTAM